MAGFPLFTDNHVRQQIVEGLGQRGWDVVRAIDVFAAGTAFAYPIKYIKPAI